MIRADAISLDSDLERLETSSIYERIGLDAHALTQRVAAAGKETRKAVHLEHLRRALEKAERIEEALRELMARTAWETGPQGD